MGIAIKLLDGHLKGRVYVERDDLAEALISTGQAMHASFEDQNLAVQQEAETPESSPAKPISRMTIAELKKEVARRGLSVGKGSGKDGAVLKSDLLDTLS